MVVTTHKRPNLLRRALESLVQQSYANFEIVCCADEGSTATKDAARDVLRASDSFLVSPKLKGPSGTRNLGVFLSKGSYICFLDDDDTFEADYLLKLAPLLESKRAELIFTNYTEIKEIRNESDTTQLEKVNISQQDKSMERLMVANFIPNNSVIVSARLAKETKFDESLESHEDWDYLLALVNRTRLTYYNIDGPNVHIPEGIAHRNIASSSIAMDFLTIYRKWRAPTNAIRNARGQFLANWGLNVPAEGL